jgi:hypothetical protein
MRTFPKLLWAKGAGRKSNAPDSGGRTSSRAANRAGIADTLEGSSEERACLRKQFRGRGTRTQSLPAHTIIT